MFNFLFVFEIYFDLICTCLLCGVCHMYVGALRRRALDSLELELQALVTSVGARN